MDWMTIGAWVLGGGGLLSGLWNWLATKRMNIAQAEQTEELTKTAITDYAGKIIEQADLRVAQHDADKTEARAERDRWQEECKGQRKAKQEWRAKHEEAVARIHALELTVKDKEAENMRLEFDKCVVPHCKNRRPPRRELATESAPLLALCFVLLTAFSCVPARNVSSSRSDSVRVEVRERTVFVRDTVWREFPLISEAVTVRIDSSHLENRYAVSDARINFDGSLYHHLATKPQREAIPIDRPVEYRDSIVYRDRNSNRVVTVEIERALTWWQQTQMRGFWLMLAIFAVMIWRKKLIAIARGILNLI